MSLIYESIGNRRNNSYVKMHDQICFKFSYFCCVRISNIKYVRSQLWSEEGRYNLKKVRF